MTRPSLVSKLAAAFVALASTGVRADDTAADAKYKSALDHFKAQDYQAACPEFEESERLGPNPSTEYYLAKCAAQAQHPAAAWNLFKKAAGGLPEPRQRAAAEQGAVDLVGQVGLVTLVGTQPAPGLEVRLDDDIVTSQVLVGLPVAVEPGPHALRATAPNRTLWSREFTIAKGESLSFTVPSLPSMADGSTAATPPTVHAVVGPDVVGSTPSGHRKTFAYVAAGAGLAGLAVGSAFGVLALNKWNDAKQGCTEQGGALVNCPTGADQIRKDAESRASISTIGFVIGGAGVAAAVVIYLTAPKESGRQKTARVVPVAPSGNPGVSVVGRF